MINLLGGGDFVCSMIAP